MELAGYLLKVADEITFAGHFHWIQYSEMYAFCLNARLLAFGYGTGIKVVTVKEVLQILGQEITVSFTETFSAVIQPGKDGLAFADIFRGPLGKKWWDHFLNS